MVRKRKGFSLLEMIACTLILSIVILGVLSAVRYVSAQKVSARNQVYMSMHQLNIMEELKQRALNGRLLAYYGESEFSTSDFSTVVYVEETSLGDFLVMNIEIDTKSVGYQDRMRNSFVLTSIGAPLREESLDEIL